MPGAGGDHGDPNAQACARSVGIRITRDARGRANRAACAATQRADELPPSGRRPSSLSHAACQLFCGDFRRWWRPGISGRRRSNISGRRRRNIAGAHLHGWSGIANDPAPTIVDGLGCPVAAGPVNRLSITRIHYVARRPRSNDSTCNHRAPNDTGGDARSPSSSASPSPSPPTPLGRSIRRSCGECHSDHRNCDSTGKHPLHGSVSPWTRTHGKQAKVGQSASP
jgi:hypothetical protein